MKYNYVYKITNLNPLSDKKYYIGVRTSKLIPEDDNYWSSSKSLKADIKKYGLDSFKKEILFTLDSRENAILKEIELHEKFDVASNKEYYNIVKQNSSGFNTQGGLFVKNKNGESIYVTKDEYNKNDELIYHSSGKISVRDKNGNTLQVNITDDKYLNGELTSVSCGMVNAIDKNGNRLYVTTVEYYKRKDLNVNNKNKVVAKYKNGKDGFLVDKNDPRFDSGILVSVHKGKVLCKDIKTGNSKYVDYTEFENNENLVGINKFNVTGSKNTNSKIIIICDYNGDIKFECRGDFEKICKDNKLPFNSLKRSYLSGGKPIYNSRRGEKEAMKRGNENYIGWFSKII